MLRAGLPSPATRGGLGRGDGVGAPAQSMRDAKVDARSGARNTENIDWAWGPTQHKRRQRQRLDVETLIFERCLDRVREQHFTGTRTLTQPGGNVHRIADDGVAHVVRRADIAGDDLPDVDADPQARLDAVTSFPLLRQP